MDYAGLLIRWWLTSSSIGVIGLLCAVEVAMACLVYALYVGDRTKGFMQRYCRTDPFIIMPLLLMYGLLVGFLGSEIRDRNQRAGRSVADEGRALDTLHYLTRSSSGELAAVRDAARHYATIVVAEEFSTLGSSGENPRAAAAIDDLQRTTVACATKPDGSQLVAGALMESAMLVKKSREERLLVLQHSSEFEWLTVISLSLLAIVSIGFGQGDKPRTMIATWTLLIPAVVVMLGLLALRENPYSPPLSVSPMPLELALRHLSEP